MQAAGAMTTRPLRRSASASGASGRPGRCYGGSRQAKPPAGGKQCRSYRISGFDRDRGKASRLHRRFHTTVTTLAEAYSNPPSPLSDHVEGSRFSAGPDFTCGERRRIAQTAGRGPSSSLSRRFMPCSSSAPRSCLARRAHRGSRSASDNPPAAPTSSGHRVFRLAAKGWRLRRKYPFAGGCFW